MNDDKLVDIESRIAWQEATLQELSDVVSRQQRQLDRLTALCVDLQARLAESADGGRASPGHEPPPHY